MYFLDGCPAGLAPVLGIVNFVINAIMIGFLYAVGVFAVVWLVTFVFDTINSASGGEINPGQADWRSCWNQIRNS